MASKRVLSSRSLFLSSPSLLPSPLLLSGHGMALAHIQSRLLREKFTSFMVSPFVVSIAGAFMKYKLIYLGLYKAGLNTDIAYFSNGGVSYSQCTSARRFASASQIRLLTTPWIYPTFGRAYASAAESRNREMGVLDELEDDDHGDDPESAEFEEDFNVEDEQRIEDSDDEEDEEDYPQSEEPAKKKVQTKIQKANPPEQQGRLLNENITARTIRLVNDDAKGHRIISTDEALTLAKGQKMDLVLVDGKATPPVCKIFDFNKEEYKQEQILKDRKKQKGATARLNEVKELRFNSKTEPKDLKMKVEQAKVFMDRGYRVKIVAMFKGRPDDEVKRLQEEKMIDAIIPMIEDVAVIEQGPRVESRQAWMLLRHLKFSKKKPPKRKSQISATEQVEEVKQEGYAYFEQSSEFSQGQEENTMHAQNASIVSKAAASGMLQGYSSKPTSPSTKPFTFQSSHPQVQPPPLQDLVDTFSPERFSPPLGGFRKETQSFQGFGGSQGSERVVSPPSGLQQSMPGSQRAGVQGGRIPTSQLNVSPLPVSSLQVNEGAQIHNPQAYPLDGMLPLQSEQYPSLAPKVQRFSMPSESSEKISQKQSSTNAPHLDKAIGSEAAQGEYRAASRGRGYPLSKQPDDSSFSPAPPTFLQGSRSHLQGPLLDFSQSPQRQAGLPRPVNLQGPLPNASSSHQESLSHQGGLSNLESPLADFFPSPSPPTFQHAPSSSQISEPCPSPFVPSQNVQRRDSLPSQGSENLPPRGVPRYPPSPLQGLPPRGFPPRYPIPPIGQPSYAPPLGQPNFQDSPWPQGQSAPGNQTQQLRGPDSMHRLQSQPRSTLDAAAAQNFPQQPNYKPEHGQDRYAPAANLFEARQHPQFGSSQPPQQGAPDYQQQGSSNLFRAPDFSQQGSSNLFRPPGQQQGPPSFFGSPQHPPPETPNFLGSPQHPLQGSTNLFGSPPRPEQAASNPFRTPPQGPPSFSGSPQYSPPGPPNFLGSPQHPQQGSTNLFGSPPRPEQAASNLFRTPRHPQQGPPSFSGSPQYPPPGPPNFLGSPQHPQQGSPNLFGSPTNPQQGRPNLFGTPPHPQQVPPRLSGSQPYIPQRPPEPSQIQFGHQPASVPQAPRQGPWLSQQGPPTHPLPMPSHPQQTGQPLSQGHQGYFSQQEAEGGSWLSQQAPSRHHPSPMPSHQQQRDQPPSQGHQGYFAQQEAEGQGQKHFVSQASQGYPPQQNQAPQTYPPPQRGFPQTGGPFPFQGNRPQNQASQQPSPSRGFPQTRPVVPSPNGFQPAWSNPPQSQEYTPLFELPSDKS